MNKFTTLMTLAATTAAGVALADLTPFDNLELSEAATFAKDGTIPELTGDLTGDAAYTLAQQGSDILKDVEKFTIQLKVGFVDSTELATLKPQGAKIGFAFTGTSTAAYFNGNVWTPVDLSALKTPISVAEEADKTLLIELDRRVTTEGKVKARFKLGETAITDWVAVADVVSNTVAIYGSGTIVSVHGATFTIAAEVIEIIPEGEDAPVVIKPTPEQAAAIGNPTTTLANGHTALTSYILFGKASTAITAADVPVVKGNPTGGDASNVAISIPNLNLQTVTGATVSFQLKGSTSGDSDTWQNVGDANATGAFTFPADTDYRYFKVVTTITYGK